MKRIFSPERFTRLFREPRSVSRIVTVGMISLTGCISQARSTDPIVFNRSTETTVPVGPNIVYGPTRLVTLPNGEPTEFSNDLYDDVVVPNVVARDARKYHDLVVACSEMAIGLQERGGFANRAQIVVGDGTSPSRFCAPTGFVSESMYMGVDGKGGSATYSTFCLRYSSVTGVKLIPIEPTRDATC